MVGFGFMDNIVMIEAGDLIDNSLGVTFGLSTLTAAGFGQVFSDTAGVLFGGVVERTVAVFGLPAAALTAAQRELPRVKWVGTASAVVGVICGCLLGMCTLLFKDVDKADRLKRQKELNTLFTAVLEQGHHLLNAERCTLFIVDERDERYVYSKVKSGDEPSLEDLKRTFALYDATDSGTVGAQELVNALQHLGIEFRIAEIEGMIDQVHEQRASIRLEVEQRLERFKRSTPSVGLGQGKGGRGHINTSAPLVERAEEGEIGERPVPDAGDTPAAGAEKEHSLSRRAASRQPYGSSQRTLTEKVQALRPKQQKRLSRQSTRDRALDKTLSFDEFAFMMKEQILKKELRIKLRDGGTKHWVVKNAAVLNVTDVRNHPLCNGHTYKYKYKTQPHTMLLGPILHNGRVVGLIETYNKKPEAGEREMGAKPHFTREDEKLLQMMCHHASIFIGQARGDGDD
eukprot:g2658.t1